MNCLTTPPPPRAEIAPGSIPLVSGWRMESYRSEENLLSWPAPQREDDFWLQASTLRFLLTPVHAFTTEPLRLTHAASGRTVLLTAQTFQFRPTRQAREEAKGATSRWNFRRRLLSPLSSKVLCLGQLLTSGNYASDGLAALSPGEAVQLLESVANTIMRRQLCCRGVIVKDLAREGEALAQLLSERGFTSLPVDPVMLMDLSSYADFEDYLSALSSKYRVRYRRARGKLEGVSRRSLSAPEVRQRLPELYGLYEETTRGADFNLTPLQPSYFGWLAGVAEFNGYFGGQGELVGFTTGIVNGSVYQAHFLGLREAYKYSHHLYHNMLYDLLGDALASRCRSLDYGRTAPEIKSSVGAVAHPIASMLRLNSPVLNRLVPRFIPAVFAAREWQPRDPFRG